MESGPRLDQEASVWLLLFYAKDLLTCEHCQGRKNKLVRGVPTVASGLCVPPHTHMPTLTQEQVEDSGSHPARAER